MTLDSFYHLRNERQAAQPPLKVEAQIQSKFSVVGLPPLLSLLSFYPREVISGERQFCSTVIWQCSEMYLCIGVGKTVGVRGLGHIQTMVSVTPVLPCGADCTSHYATGFSGG